jgi:hypothetical protein
MAGQKRRRFGAEISKDNPRKLLDFISGLTNAFFKTALGGLAGHLQDPTAYVVKPAVVAAAQAAILDMAELQRSASMQAPELKQAYPADIIAKKNEIFAQKSPADRSALQFQGKPNGMPIPAQHLSPGCSRTDTSKHFIFF